MIYISASYDTWTSVCEDYAVQLETDGQYHKAASYFLACHKVYEAIRLFKRHKLFKYVEFLKWNNPPSIFGSVQSNF